ncbi:helix-turn-helix domain-containing protein [Alicyclobacillus mengziensis]|uniref:ImmA/IrrE family metallo-endopeptidase n=1 Tax=Alicyclobacillus mengziensis TaxID=2931921 RepID=A0A9X7W100_9BACL|nr:XRE family transcriptional regulator [Alicyclobacillus mengziensis]QSO48761.1 ImmA/IrrE family metallo-endopeptidase [Alicyclobacillus mengziensis]
MEQNIIGSNLRRIREAKGWSQDKAAELSGISRPAYRNIETGASTPKVSTLQSIADGLGVKLQDLITPVRTLENVRFRALKRMNSREQILNEVARWLDDFNYLENLLQNKENYRFEDLVHRLSSVQAGVERAKRAAELAREELDLHEKEPIRDIAGLLESSGIKLYPISLASDGFFGLSVSELDGGPAVAVNVWERISVERWIFSAAHELGHLLLHLDAYNVNESQEDDSQETEANIFASYFLMPQRAFESEWEETYGLAFVDRVLKVKRIFQVSYKTVLYRLAERDGGSVWGKFQAAYKSRTGKTLKIMDEPEALLPHSFHQSMSEVLRSQEPDSLSASDFIEDRLSRLVRLAIESDKITLSRGAEILRLDLEAMRERVSSWE